MWIDETSAPLHAEDCRPTKQDGSKHHEPGIIYFMLCKSDHITRGYLAGEHDWVSVKVGLATGGEKNAFATLSGHRTSNPGDTYNHNMIPVADCGAAETVLHGMLWAEGYGTLAAYNRNVPTEWRDAYHNQEGGGEWFVIPMTELKRIVAMWEEGFPHMLNHVIPTRFVTNDGWIGESKSRTLRHGVQEDGTVQQVIRSKAGRPTEPNAKRFAWQYRACTGHAPEGDCYRRF